MAIADLINDAISSLGLGGEDSEVDALGNYYKKSTKFTPSDPGFADSMAQYTSPQVAKDVSDIMRNIPDGRRSTPPSYYEYIKYPHREDNDEYHLRIGDCCFVLPPEFISVKTLSGTDSLVGLRQDSSVKTKHGYSKKEIVVTLYLNGIDQINGYRVESPMDYPYYVDGLRPLISQFKCTPFLPVENEFLNTTCGIFSVALSSMGVSLVPGFPECLQVNLIMQEFNAAPYIENLNLYYDDYIDWDMFRFYYQQLLREDSRHSIKLKPIKNARSLTGKFNFYTLKPEALDTEGMDIFSQSSYDRIVGSEDGVDIADMNFSLSNMLTVIQLSDHSSPTHQYFGGMDTIFSMTIETTDKDIVRKFTDMNTMTQLMVRKSRDFNGLGFIKIDNELVNLTGTQYLMIDDIAINTVPEFPDLTSITLECISFDSTQGGKEQLNGMRPFEGNTKGTKEDALQQSVKGIKNKAKQDTMIEKKLMEMELYPDLHLPLHTEVNVAVNKIREFRTKHALTNIGYTQYPKSFSVVPGSGPNGTYSKYLEPDFYVFYPMKFSDIEDDAFDTMKTPRPPVASATTIPKRDYGDEDLPTGATVDKDGKITWLDSIKKFFTGEEEETTTTIPRTGNALCDLLLTKAQGNCGYVWGADGQYLTTNYLNNLKSRFGSAEYTGENAQYMTKYMGKQVFDCSGFVCWGLRELGIAPKGYRENNYGVFSNYSTPITRNELRPGDLCFNSYHIAVYIGDNQTVEAMSTEYGVKIGNVGNRFTQFGRVKGLPTVAEKEMSIEDESHALRVQANKKKEEANNPTSAITVEKMDNALGGVLKGHGREFIQFGKDYGVDPVLIAAICAQESARGTSDAVRYSNNPSGIMDWDNSYRTIRTFSTLTEGIEFTFGNIKKYYIDEGLTTIAQIGAKYCPVGADNDPNDLNRHWVPNVTQFYSDISGGVYVGAINMDKVPVDNTISTFEFPELNKAGKKVGTKTGVLTKDKFGKPIYYKSPIMALNGSTDESYKNIQEKFQLSAEDTFSSMTVDMATYSKRGNMARAFPSYLLLICDDGGEWLDARKLWSNFYVYKSVIDISVFQESSQPVHTATLRVTNVYHNISKAPKAKSIKKMILDDPEYNKIQHGWYKLTGSLLGSPKLTESMVDVKNELFDNINMKTGARIHLRMGYGSNPIMMPICFNGVVAEMDVGDVVTLVAQSDGAELVGSVISTDEKETNKLTKLQSEPSDIVASLLVARYSFWENALSSDWGEKSKYGIEHFGIFTGNQLKKHDEYDLCKNVYYGKYDCKPFCQNVFGNMDGEENLNFFLYNKTPWDALQIATQFLPEFVCQPMYHQFESRLFYGLPVWSAKYKYDYKNNGDIYEYAKSFSQFHYLDSMCDIIDNQVKVSSDEVSTNMIGTYSIGGKLTSTPVIYSDKSIDWSMQKTKVIDTTATQDYIGWDWLYEHLPGLSLDVGKSAAIKIVISNIMDGWAKSYLNPIMILGDATIKPCDYLFINDGYADMRGLCTAREVVHHMSIDAGFTTNIVPSMISTNNMGYSGMGNVIKTCVSCGGAVAAVYGLRHLGIQTAFRIGGLLGIGKTLNAIEKSGTFFKGAKTITSIGYDAIKTGKMVKDFSTVTGEMRLAADITRTAANAKKVGTLVNGVKGAMVAAGSAFPLLGNIIMWLVSEVIFDVILVAVMDEFQWSNTISLSPLIYKGQPFVSGCKGYSKLIPGFKDSDSTIELE